MIEKDKFVVVDGIDGVGKATQVRLMARKLRRLGYKVKTIDFPGYTRNFFGKMIRRYLDGEFGSASEVDPHLVSTWYASDRLEDKDKINKWLSEGYVVIADRYASSNAIHQGGKIKSKKKRAEFLKWLDEMEFKTYKIPRPDAIIFLDMPIEFSKELLKGRATKKKKAHLKIKKDIHESDEQHLRDARESAIDIVKKSNKWININCVEDGKVLPKAKITKIILEKLNFRKE